MYFIQLATTQLNSTNWHFEFTIEKWWYQNFVATQLIIKNFNLEFQYGHLVKTFISEFCYCGSIKMIPIVQSFVIDDDGQLIRLFQNVLIAGQLK